MRRFARRDARLREVVPVAPAGLGDDMDPDFERSYYRLTRFGFAGSGRL